MAKRSYRTIHDWTNLSAYKDCIMYCFENTPVPLADDQYMVISHAVINLTTYKNAGCWMERATKSVIMRNDAVHQPLDALEWLYEPHNRLTLENCIRKQKDNFPFHQVQRIETVSDEREQELYQDLVDDEKQERILAKHKWRQRHAKRMADLEQKVEEQAATIQEQAKLLEQKDKILEEKEEALHQLNAAYSKALDEMSGKRRGIGGLEEDSEDDDEDMYSMYSE